MTICYSVVEELINGRNMSSKMRGISNIRYSDLAGFYLVLVLISLQTYKNGANHTVIDFHLHDNFHTFGW